MRRVAILLVMFVAASPAAAQDDEPTLGVSTAPQDDEPALGVSTAPSTSDASSADVADDAASTSDENASDENARDENASEENASDESASEESASEESASEESASDDDEAPPAPHWTDERAAAWATFIASFGLAVGGGVLLAVGVDEVNTIENAADGTVWADVAGSLDRAPIFTGVGAAVLGLGVAGTITGAALLALYGGEGTWVEVSVLPGGLTARGRF